MNVAGSFCWWLVCLGILGVMMRWGGLIGGLGKSGGKWLVVLICFLPRGRCVFSCCAFPLDALLLCLVSKEMLIVSACQALFRRYHTMLVGNWGIKNCCQGWMRFCFGRSVDNELVCRFVHIKLRLADVLVFIGRGRFLPRPDKRFWLNT